jgi:hypothetical protein
VYSLRILYKYPATSLGVISPRSIVHKRNIDCFPFLWHHTVDRYLRSHWNPPCKHHPGISSNNFKKQSVHSGSSIGASCLLAPFAQFIFGMLRCMSYTNSIHRTVAPSLEQLLSTGVISPLPGKRRHSFTTSCGNQSKDEIQETERPLR